MGNPKVVNPTKELKEIANKRQWEIITTTLARRRKSPLKEQIRVRSGTTNLSTKLNQIFLKYYGSLVDFKLLAPYGCRPAHSTYPKIVQNI